MVGTYHQKMSSYTKWRKTRADWLGLARDAKIRLELQRQRRGSCRRHAIFYLQLQRLTTYFSIRGRLTITISHGYLTGNDNNCYRMATETRKFRHQDYTVAWICALPLEMAAAKVMLDDGHPDLPTNPNDNNTYILGRIHAHNVVLVCLPSGVPGTTSAAVVATELHVDTVWPNGWYRRGGA
jgi:hypothetical protein